MSSAADDAKNGTRVFKKTSPNGKITTYLGKRDFIDHGDHVELIDGMVLIDPAYMATDGKKVFATLLAAFCYGREDLDVLGLQFRKDLLADSFQVYPPDPEACLTKDTKEPRKLTRLQERLKKKLGDHAYPFWFEIPPNSASSVTLQPAPGDTGKPCGVDYELKSYISEGSSDKPKKSNCVKLAIRKLTYAPAVAGRPQPSIEATKEFMMSPGLLHMEASLDKEENAETHGKHIRLRKKIPREIVPSCALYYHGETISVNVHIQNNSNKTVKKIRVAVAQIADICLFTTANYTCEVAKVESAEGFPVGPGGTLSKVYTLCPLLANNKDKRGLALDGKLKHEDTNLASSTIIKDPAMKETLGIIVQYRVKIRLTLTGVVGGELIGELPFTLTHPKPVEERCGGDGVDPLALDMDLIELDTSAEGGADDIIFEDFARLRLKGEGDDQD